MWQFRCTHINPVYNLNGLNPRFQIVGQGNDDLFVRNLCQRQGRVFAEFDFHNFAFEVVSLDTRGITRYNYPVCLRVFRDRVYPPNFLNYRLLKWFHINIATEHWRPRLYVPLGLHQQHGYFVRR